MWASGSNIDRARGRSYELEKVAHAEDLDQRNGVKPLRTERDSDQRVCDDADAQCERRAHEEHDGENVEEDIAQAFGVVRELGLSGKYGSSQRHEEVRGNDAC